ncbi:MAG: carboxypeptidase regulatory-like domain-containing protein, partial [Lentimicrobiaceae bacterium]|nr:carboxypeptidase regulatory-like domain-containing protein [Lentimicrobiaceae bacterium]
MNGTQLGSHYYHDEYWFMGSVYDPYSNPAAPCVWLMSQVPGGHAIVREYDINSQTMTNYSYNVGNDHPQCGGNAGGGMSSYIDKNRKFRIVANVQTSPNINLIYELADLMPSGAPAAVSNAMANAGMFGSLNVMLSWTNPSTTYSGAPLTELTAVKVYENNVLIHTASNPTIGGGSNHLRQVSEPGYYTFTFVPENSHGTGTLTTINSSWIGHDVPVAPGNPAFVIDNSVYNESWTVTASWTAPTAGLHGGYFSSANLKYDVYRMPGNVLVSESHTGTSFSETITQPGSYYYKITAKNHVGNGESVNTPELDLCWDLSVPWTETFPTSAFPPTCWKRYALTGSVNWLISSSLSFSPPYSAAIWSYATGARNTWLVTPEITLPNTGSFSLEFQSRVDFAAYYGSSEVWISTESNDPASGTFVMLKQLVSGVDFGTTADWRAISVSLEEYLGTSFYIGFRYLNNSSSDYHAWFIDDISIRDVPAIDAAAKKLFGSLTPMVGEPFVFKANIENVGSLPLTNYTVKLVDANNNVLATNSNPPVIAPGETEFVKMNWSPATAGNLTLYAVVEATGDPNSSNDKSPAFPVVIQPANEIFEGKIGNGTTLESAVPFGFVMRYSAAQSLHFDHEIIGRGGSITQLQYFNSFSVAVTHPAQIWMANTTQTSLTDWVPESDLTLVFDGMVTFPAGVATVTIVLDQPFSYTGDNLVIMSKPEGQMTPIPGMKMFYITETPEFQDRTLFYFNNVMDFNWTQPGVSVNFHANTVLKIANETMGSISGTVTSNGTTPVEGATVEILGTSFQRTTDATGAYSFEFLVPGEYQLKASKFGYLEATSEVVTVAGNENTVVNFVIAPNTTCTVSGKITGNDAPNGLANVTVTLSGYDNYSTTTDNLGNYSIPNVFGGYTYAIKAMLQGYQPYTSTIEVTAGAITHNISMNEIAYPAVGVTAEVVGNNAVVTWGAPGNGNLTAYRYDSGTNNGHVGWPNGTRNSIIGAAHKDVKTELHNMSWLSSDYFNQTAYDLWVLGLNAAGLPDRNNVIFTVQNVTNTPGQWCSFEFPEPLYISNGFFIGISPSFGGYTCMGIDEPNDEYPFVPNTSLFSFAPNEPWECFSTNGFFQNAMIRAEGMSLGKGVLFGEKGFISYMVYRLLEGEQSNEASWVLLAQNLTATTYTDADWGGLSGGEYRYAVKAAYTGGLLSAPKFSNMLGKDMEVSYTVNLSTNSGDPVTGALVTLTNVNGNPNHVYKVTATGGTVSFPAIWKGTYNISVVLDGFHPYTTNNIVINQSGLSHTAQLVEIIIKPYMLKIEKNGTDGERLFLWNLNYTTTYILDDGSGEDGFGMNAGFNVSLGNKFVVSETGVITSVDIYGFHNFLTELFGHRTVTLDIYNEQQQLVWQSAPFHLASDNWGNVPVDNIPYSGTFYAMVHWYETGTEPTNFLGADYDGPNAFNNYDMALYEGNWDIAHIAFQDAPFVCMIRVNAEVGGPGKSVTYDNNKLAKTTGVISKDFAKAVTRMENPVSVDTKAKYEVHKSTVGGSRAKLGYTVYLNGVEKATNLSETEFLFTGLAKGAYKAGVKSVYTSGASEIVTIDFEVDENSIATNTLENVVLFPNPFTNEIHISHPELVKNVKITDIVGKQITTTAFNGKTISCSTLSSGGIYFVELESLFGEKMIYKMVKE